jgi:hypothetical protein
LDTQHPLPERDADSTQFLFHQYDSLRKEIEQFGKELGMLAAYAAIASGTVWTFLVTNNATLAHASHHRAFISCIPAVFVSLMALRAVFVRKAIHEASAHCAKIEEAFGLDTELGWDTWQKGRRGNKYFLHALDKWLYLYWTIVIIANVSACIIYLGEYMS